MQVEPMKPMLKALGNERLKLKCDIMLSNSAFTFNLRRYTKMARNQWILQQLGMTTLVAGAYTRSHFSST